MALARLLGRGGQPLTADWLVVGLGNPGPRHGDNRHNVGFWVANEVARRAHVQPRSAGASMVAGVGELASAKVAIVKPMTFMNNSGKAVAQALKATGCDLSRTIVAYDELDLATGALRIRQGGGHGGHNGLRSIAAHAGLEFIRIRIGIGRPIVNGAPSRHPDDVAAYVLSDASGDERRVLMETVSLAVDAIEVIISDGVDVAGNRFNRR